MTTATEKIVTTIAGVEIWTESFGDPANPGILLIMGAMNQGLFWPQTFCEELANAGFLVIRYDNRDTGKSSTINYSINPYTLDDMAEDAIAILDAYKLAKTTVIGMSMGGYIAQLIGINYPSHVDKLILLSSSPDQRPYMYSLQGTYMGQFPLSPPCEDYLFQLAQASFYMPKTPEEVVKSTLDSWHSIHSGSLPFPEQEMTMLIKESMARMENPMAVMNHGAAVGNSPDRLKTVQQIKAPTLVLHGEFDPVLPIDHGQYLADNIEGAQLVKLDMGHLFPPTMSQLMAEHVINFIKS
ncbi:alpha/beta fold hydrolase [Entomomonas asaccharolytica]|uniref:Alpha/beta hydrolase n=1 Tax=Entomomonas asaccharolytica TaxID=2785331 RepID=A0A974ND42_9GAMM|nr:alpha/beta hydrolase [Entomomonas asaccharolytica]QQP84385.1 alpha/beta hydrolase [Entomomonas asaccharolytica]